MKDFWNGLAGIAKALIIAVTLVILGFMLMTCGMFSALMYVPA